MKLLHTVLFAAAFSILGFNVTHGEDIINGRKAKKNSLQYMASVQLNGKHKCGGFLISPSYVLTAAHCDRSGLSVVIGSQNIDPNTSNLRKYAVKSNHPHPDFNKNKVIKGYDIMLLELSEKVKLDKYVKIIKISRKGKKIKPNTKCQVAGWGQTETEERVNDLRVVDVSTINMTVCKEQWKERKKTLPENVLCAGGYGTQSGACQGDSGGPLVCSGLAVGIVSFNLNDNCKYPNVPNVYTDISAYADWIKKVMNGDAWGVL